MGLQAAETLVFRGKKGVRGQDSEIKGGVKSIRTVIARRPRSCVADVAIQLPRVRAA